MEMTTCKSCNKPISEHKADRKTNVCVAKAMGWKISAILKNAGWKLISDPRFDKHPRYREFLQPIPHYSTDIRDALEFAKYICKLLEEKYGDDSDAYCDISYHSDGSACVQFKWCATDQSPHGHCGLNGNDDNLALAIVNAGLETYAFLTEAVEEK